MHNSKHDDLCKSHLPVHYIVRFVWYPALFHNYILEMLNFPPFQCLDTKVSEKCITGRISAS